MEFIKYYTNPTFNRQEFVDMLRLKMNVRAKVVDDGVILDRQAFNDVPLSLMPHWAFINRKYINSELHTRPAKPMEWPDLSWKMRFTVCILHEDTDPCPLEGGDGFDYLKEQAKEIHKHWEGEEGFICAAIVDNTTGEVLYTSNDD